jgi:hypothetical protein
VFWYYFILIFFFLKFVGTIYFTIMKLLIISSFFLLATVSINAQIFVKDNSFIFDKGSLVYTKGNVELNGANSNFYLRNEGQLIQGTTATSTNKGIGKLSVFQEGTSNNYAYNYWCSPVGNSSTTSGNEDFGITQLSVPTTNVSSTPASILAMNNYDGVSSNGSLAIAPYWIWKYQSGTTFPEWIQAGSNAIISAGQGFTMKGTSGTDATNIGEIAVNNPGSAQRYDFRGKPNDGNITVNVAPTSTTLTGNPYPSAMNVQDFLLDPANVACTGIAYYWEQDKSSNSHLMVVARGGYGTYSPGLGPDGSYAPATYYNYNIGGSQNTSLSGTPSVLNIKRKYAPIGQGFEIEGTASAGSVTIKNSYRAFKKESISSDLTGFEKNATTADLNSTNIIKYNEASQLRLSILLNNQYNRQIILGFQDNATNGVDRGIDAKSPDGNDLPNDSYFFLDNNQYVIQGIKFDVNKRVPLGVKMSEAGSMVFKLPFTVNFDENQAVYIYDSLDDSYHNLREADYEVTLSAGVFNNRFEITFVNSAFATSSSNMESLEIVQNNFNQMLSISNPNNLQFQEVALYDILGKLVVKQDNFENKLLYEYATATISDGVYIVKIKTLDGFIRSQKILVKNKKE